MFLAVFRKLYRGFISPFRRRWVYYSLKMKLHGKVRFTSKAHISKNSEFEGANSIGDGTTFSGKIGFGSYIAPNSCIYAEIGKFCSIGNGVRTMIGTHPISEPYATTSPIFFSLRKQAMQTFAKQQMFDEILPPVKIGNDCWIGDNACIVGGKTLGNGCVVLAGAMVTKDVPPYAIVGGVPANVLKYRYDEDTIRWLLDIQWWNMPLDWLKENSELLCDIDSLKKTLEKRTLLENDQ